VNFISVSKEDGIATVTLNRGKVNALNEHLIEQLDKCFGDLERDEAVKAIIFTAQGKFFSFGFDIPEFTKFTNLYTSMFLFPKPVVAALNGHAIAGGCMLALACDSRIMTSGKAKISLNEISFGSSVFAGSVEMLKFCVGAKNAESVLYSGAMYTAEEAIQLGLIDRISSPENLMAEAGKAGRQRNAGIQIHKRPIAEARRRRNGQKRKRFDPRIRGYLVF